MAYIFHEKPKLSIHTVSNYIYYLYRGKSEFASLSHKSSAFMSQCKRTIRIELNLRIEILQTYQCVKVRFDHVLLFNYIKSQLLLINIYIEIIFGILNLI